MTTRASSLQSFPGAKKIWDAVYELSRRSPNSEIVVRPPKPFKSNSERIKFMHQLYRYRKLLQKENAKLYPDGHPNHGTTIFDAFEITRITNENGALVLKFIQRTAEGYVISTGDAEIVVDAPLPQSE